MNTYTDRGLPKARKRYRCYVCGGVIEKGEAYGREWDLKSHFECPVSRRENKIRPTGKGEVV